jgi:hypothetical protein
VIQNKARSEAYSGSLWRAALTEGTDDDKLLRAATVGQTVDAGQILRDRSRSNGDD